MKRQNFLFAAMLVSISAMGFQAPSKADPNIADPEVQQIVDEVNQMTIYAEQWQRDRMTEQLYRENQLSALCVAGYQTACIELQLINNRLERELQMMKE